MKRGKKASFADIFRILRMSGPRSRRRPPKRGGSEPVTAEPDRPKLNEGGAAAALEFDE
jgi:hypothetical protein